MNDINTKFQIRQISDHNTGDLVNLLSVSLGQNSEASAKTEQFWNWKHRDSPFGPSYGLTATNPSDATIAGLRVLMHWELVNREGEHARCARAVDTATHPDFQRMGIFSRLTKAAVKELTENGVDIIFNTPNLKSKPGYLKMGWEEVTSWPVYINVRKPVAFTYGITAGRKFNRKRTIPVREEVFTDEVWTYKELTEKYSPDMLRDFFSDVEAYRNSCPGWHTPISFDYVTWRYGSHPSVDYGFVITEYNGEPQGIAVLRRNTRFGLKEIIVADLFLPGNAAESGKKLLRKVKQCCHPDYFIAHYNQQTQEYNLLRKSGFIKAPGQSIDFTVRELASSTEKFNHPAYWNLTLGDLEMF